MSFLGLRKLEKILLEKIKEETNTLHGKWLVEEINYQEKL